MSLQHQFSRFASVSAITFRNTIPDNPLINVKIINYLKEDGVSGIFTNKEYRYSFNNKDFSNWASLSIFALQSIKLTGNNNLYLEIKYNRVGVNSGDINQLYLLYESTEDQVDNINDASINADYFQGKLPSYYLDNNNHFGNKYITTIDVSNNYWHTSGDTTVSTPSIYGDVNFIGNVNIDGSIIGVPSGKFDSSQPDGTLVSDTIGGISSGTDVSTLRDKTFTSLFDDILFRTLNPTISSNKSLNDSGISSATLEVGTTQTLTITGTFTKGLILNGDGSPGPTLVGDPNEWRFKLPDSSINKIISSTNLIEVHSFSSYIINKGSNIWRIELDHDIGTGPYYDSKGNISNILDSNRVAASLSAASPSKTGAYGFFYGFGTAPTTSAGVRLGTKVLLNQSDSGTFDITFLDADTDIWFATFGTPNYTVTQDPTGLPIDITGLFSDSIFNVDDAGSTARNYQTSAAYYGAAGHGDLIIRIIIL